MENLNILNQDGKVINSSRNLRGIRDYINSGKDQILKSSITKLSDGSGKLLILFESKNSFETNFNDYTILKDWINNFKNYDKTTLIIIE